MAKVYSISIRPSYGRYIGSTCLDERFDKHANLKPKFRTAPPMKDGMIDYNAIKLVHPTKMGWKDAAGREMPDFYDNLGFSVSEQVKSLIEQVEPDLHQFEPVTWVYSKGKQEDQRYWFRVNQQVDALNFERSNMVKFEGAWMSAANAAQFAKWKDVSDFTMPIYADPEKSSAPVFREEVVCGIHVFNTIGLGSSHTLVSETLFMKFKELNLTGLNLTIQGYDCI